MSGWLLGVVTVIYLGVALAYWLEGRAAMAFVFLGYSLANLGLIAEGWK